MSEASERRGDTPLPIHKGKPLKRDGVLYALNSTEPLNAKVQTFYKNGQLEAEFTAIDGKQQGRYQRWHQNGQPAIEKTPINGKNQFTTKTWNRDGQLESEATEVNGRMTSVYQTWHEQGELRSKTTYVDSMKEGWYRQYDTQGVEVATVCYRADEETSYIYCKEN